MIECGRHPARARGAVLCVTSKGNEQVAVRLETPDGEVITWYGSFSEKAYPYTIGNLRTLGWRGVDLSDLSMLDEGPEVSIVVEDEEFNGRVSRRVRWINEAGGLSVKNALTPGEARAFAAQMRAKIAALGLGQSGPQLPEPPPPPEVGKEDIPF